MAPNTRRRQQRITFTPIPASSSQAEGYNKQIQDRAAAVGYGSSSRSSKRRKLQPSAIGDENDATQEANTIEMLPTPAEDPQANDESAVRSSRKASKLRAKQQRLDFGPSSGVNLDPPTGQTMFKEQRGQKRAAATSSDDSDGLPSPGRFAKGAKKKNKRKAGFMHSSGAEEARSSQAQKQPTPEEQEDSDSDEVVLPSARKARRNPPQITAADDEDSEDEMPTTLGTQKRRRQERQSSFISSSPPAAIDGSDDDLQIIDDPKGKNKRTTEDEDDEDDEDLQPVTPGRRLQKRRGKFTKEEQDDLDEDLQFLGPSSDGEEPGRAPQSSQTIKRKARQQALERLKQVRSSQKTLADVQEEDQDEAQDLADQQERDEMYDNSEESPEPGPTSSRAMFAADEDDDDFIEEGDDDTLGVPEGIPLMYTRYASMKSKELWKFAIEWMVQKKINPAFAMDDEIYELTFKKLDDEVSGLADSKFQSSAWKTDFTTALRARPEILENLTDMEQDKCDACNRSRHPVKYRVQFQGNPYHRSTLEDVGKDDDDDDEDDEDDSSNSDNEKHSNGDNPSYDAQGREIAPANHVWYVGKFCMANARTAHALQHWRYHLYQWVVIWIDGHGYSSPKKLQKRDKMSTKKRRKYANKIVDRMVDEGIVKQLWKEFRGTIDDAANSKQGRFEVGSP